MSEESTKVTQSTAQMRSQRQILALRRRLGVAAEKGDLYEMGQVYRLMIAKYTTLKNYDEVKNLCIEAVNTLTEKKDYTEAASIGTLLIKAWKLRETSLSEAEIDLLRTIANKLDINEKNARSMFIHDAVVITRSSTNPSGDKKLNGYLGDTYTVATDFGSAQSYYVYSDNVEGFVKSLIEWDELIPEEDEDLLITRACLLSLTENTPEFAREVFCQFARARSWSQSCVFHKPYPKFSKPLLNAIYLILSLTKFLEDPSNNQDAKNTFINIKEKYNPSFSRDKTFDEMLKKVGEKYFGIAPPQQQPSLASLFGNMMRSFQ